MSDYPSEIVLKQIREYDCIKAPLKPLLELIESEWWESDRGYKLDGDSLELHTGGWSGNEDIISALETNFSFWGATWLKSERGGHYTFSLETYRNMSQNITDEGAG